MDWAVPGREVPSALREGLGPTSEPEVTPLRKATGELKMDIAPAGVPIPTGISHAQTNEKGRHTFWRIMIKDHAKARRRARVCSRHSRSRTPNTISFVRAANLQCATRKSLSCAE